MNRRGAHLLIDIASRLARFEERAGLRRGLEAGKQLSGLLSDAFALSTKEGTTRGSFGSGECPHYSIFPHADFTGETDQRAASQACHRLAYNSRERDTLPCSVAERQGLTSVARSQMSDGNSSF